MYSLRTVIVFLFIVSGLTVLSSCHQEIYKNPTVEIETTYGDIFVELYPKKAPLTVAAFLSYVSSGVYRNSNFYRVLKGEDQPSNADKTNLIQGGIYYSDPDELTKIKGIPLETTKKTGLTHDDGSISIARTLPNSGRTEFFIAIGDLKGYDYGGNATSDKLGFAVFGKVIRGMNVVREIHKRSSTNDHFDKPVLIKDIIYLNK